MALKEKLSSILSDIKAQVAGLFKEGDRDFQFLMNIVIIILINVAAVTLNVRFDLTRSDSYSLSEKSREVVSGLKENLKIRVLFSKDLPAEHKSLYRYLVDLLEEYDYYGSKYFSYTIVDEDDLEKEAGNFGIRPVKSQEYVDDQVKLRKTYMGLVIQQADLVEKIPALTSASGLEFQITSLMMKMSGKIDSLIRLKEDITLNLYLDSNLKELPIEGINNVEQRVTEAVEKSNVTNYNRIKLKVIDTSQKDQQADLQSMYGIKKLPWKGGVLKSGKRIASGEGYLGIVLKTGKKFSVIELAVLPTIFGNYVVNGLDGLEDRINDAVTSLVSTNPRVGYIIGHEEPSLKDERTREGAGLLNKLLEDLYEVKEIDLTKEEIPADMAAIIINGPKREFSDYELFKIDQFLMKGKSAIVFVDSFQEIHMQGQQNMFGQQPMVLPLNTKLEKLLAAYGITVNKDLVLDKSCARVNMGNSIADYPVVPIIKPDGMNSESVITNMLKGAAFFKTSSVDVDKEMVKKNSLITKDLVSSSPESWLMKGRINFNPAMMQAGPDAEFKNYPLAVLVAGSMESYFKDKDIPVDEQEKGKKTSIGITKTKLDRTIESGKTQLIVVGTSEITRTGFLMDSRRIIAASGPGQGQGGDIFSNGLLLHNMVDYVTGNYFIPEMKGKSLEYNPLDQTSDKERFIFKGMNIAGVPLLVIIAGLIVWRRRRSRRQKIQQEFAS